MTEQSNTNKEQLITSTQERKERITHLCQCKSRDSDRVLRTTMTVKISFLSMCRQDPQRTKTTTHSRKLKRETKPTIFTVSIY